MDILFDAKFLEVVLLGLYGFDQEGHLLSFGMTFYPPDGKVITGLWVCTREIVDPLFQEFLFLAIDHLNDIAFCVVRLGDAIHLLVAEKFLHRGTTQDFNGGFLPVLTRVFSKHRLQLDICGHAGADIFLRTFGNHSWLHDATTLEASTFLHSGAEGNTERFHRMERLGSLPANGNLAANLLVDKLLTFDLGEGFKIKDFFGAIFILIRMDRGLINQLLQIGRCEAAFVQIIGHVLVIFLAL